MVILNKLRSLISLHMTIIFIHHFSLGLFVSIIYLFSTLRKVRENSFDKILFLDFN